LDLLTHYLLPFVGILLGLVILHEAGHYVTAKMFGVKVLEAGIGLPPRIWGFTRRDTIYSINALPVGAFVRMLGEEDPSDPQSMAAQPKWKRAVIIGSGAFVNLIVAISLFTVALMVPREISAGGAEVTNVIPGSPAEKAGLQPGDQILEVNGRKAESQQDAAYLVRLYQGSNIDFTVKRDDPRRGSEVLHINDVYARWNPRPYDDECGVKQPQGPTGIQIGATSILPVSRTPEELADLERDARKGFAEYKGLIAEGAPAHCYAGSEFGFVGMNEARCASLAPEEQAAARALKSELFAEASGACYEFRPPTAFEVVTRTRSEPIWEATPHALRLSFESLILTRNQVWTLVRGYGGSPVTGPVGIAQATGEVVDQAGWKSLVDLAASISMSLAILNILPIPMFDGGRLAFIFIEFIRGGRRIAPEKEALVHFIGFAAILVLALVITYYDVARIINGDSLLR
jgi:regulator of sigma E protease